MNFNIEKHVVAQAQNERSRSLFLVSERSWAAWAPASAAGFSACCQGDNWCVPNKGEQHNTASMLIPKHEGNIQGEVTDHKYNFVFVQGAEPLLTFTHLATFPTGIGHTWIRNCRSLAVLPSGKVVVFGGGKDFNTSSGDPERFHVYSGFDTEWRKLKQLPELCGHRKQMRRDMVPVTIGSQELLAVSCDECEVIRLLNLEMGESRTAFFDPCLMKSLNVMCEGEQGQIFVNHGRTLLLNCSSEPFTIVNFVEHPAKYLHDICYVSRHKLIVARYPPGRVGGFDCETMKLKWEWSGKSWNIMTHRIVYSPGHDAVIFCFFHSSGLNEVSVLNACDGMVRQQLNLPREVRVVWDMRVRDGELILLHGKDKDLLSCFSLLD